MNVKQTKYKENITSVMISSNFWHSKEVSNEVSLNKDLKKEMGSAYIQTLNVNAIIHSKQSADLHL